MNYVAVGDVAHKKHFLLVSDVDFHLRNKSDYLSFTQVFSLSKKKNIPKNIIIDVLAISLTFLLCFINLIRAPLSM